MLANTLCHIPRVSLNKERALWDKGVQTWDSYRALAKNPAFLDDCAQHLEERNAAFFADYLKSDQHWRLFGDFQDSVAYVDIETTGLDKGYDQITTIALYDGDEVKTYVNGRNLAAFKSDILNYKLLVTFNGKTFDVPFIQRSFGIELQHAHIDLRYGALRRKSIKASQHFRASSTSIRSIRSPATSRRAENSLLSSKALSAISSFPTTSHLITSSFRSTTRADCQLGRLLKLRFEHFAARR